MGNTKTEILLVEDSRTQAVRLSHILENGGYTVSVASNGREALEKLAVRRPALVLSDVIMPEMDGYELCRRIKGDDSLKDIPVLLVTYLSNIEDVLRGLEAGANNFVMKPYESDFLLSRIRRTLAAFSCRDAPLPPCPVPVGRSTFQICSDRRDILETLLSTYETALHKNERLTAAKEELRSANQELEAFSSSVSHDLRTPLSVILGYADFLLTEGELEEKEQSVLEAIQQAGNKMNRLIEDLLNLSKASRTEIRREEIDLSLLVRDILQELQREEPERPAELRVEEAMKISGDASLLHIALENLLRNAWKFTSREELTRIEVGREADGAYFIRDNGAGFDMKESGKIFASFRRLHSQDEFPGTGLGLAIVQRIITRHGGRIWARGEVGRGATFYFMLSP